MEAITGKKIFDINLLYIIDVDVKIEMSDIFEKCLQKDRNTLCNRFTFKIYLIFTQPDLELKKYLKESIKKNYYISSIQKTINENKAIIKDLSEKISTLKSYFNYPIKKHINQILFPLSEEIYHFCKNVHNENQIKNQELISVGLSEVFNENHKALFASLNFMSTSFRNEINKKSFLIDVSTFSFVNFNTVGDEIFANKAVEDYKESIKYIQKFNNAYILVDYIFMNNFQEIEKENNLLSLNIYMFEGNYFIMNLYKDKDKIMDEIKIFKNKCQNPMLFNESDYLSLS